MWSFGLMKFGGPTGCNFVSLLLHPALVEVCELGIKGIDTHGT